MAPCYLDVLFVAFCSDWNFPGDRFNIHTDPGRLRFHDATMSRKLGILSFDRFFSFDQTETPGGKLYWVWLGC